VVLTLHDFIPHATGLVFKSLMIAGKRPRFSPLDAVEQIEFHIASQIGTRIIRI
jgi:hypothetical protein